MRTMNPERISYRYLYARLFRAMSLERARQVLGFPPGAWPSDDEARQAKKRLVKKTQLHPDVGGSHRKMVEVNVAFDVLTGRQRPSADEPEEVRETEAEKRERLIREAQERDIGIVEIFQASAEREHQLLTGQLRAFRPKYEINLRKYLIVDYAQKLDDLQDAAEDALRKKLDPKEKKFWQQADKLAGSLAGKALRLGTKVGKIWKWLKELDKTSASFSDIKTMRQKLKAFIDSFHEFRTESGKLISLLFTVIPGTDDNPAPLVLAEAISDGHQMVLQFDEGYQRLKFDRKADKFQAAIEDTLDTLKKRDIAASFPSWEDWRVPDDFERAVEEIGKSRWLPDED